MPTFPDITPDFGYKRKASTGVEVRQATSGKEWRRRAWPRTRQSFEMAWPLASAANAKTLREFYDARQGEWASFTFFDFKTRAWSVLTCDETGTGALTTFTLPAKTTSGHTVYVDGVAEAAENYSIGDGTGDEDEDQIVFDGGHEPADGAVVTADLTGRRRYTCRFEGEMAETAVNAITFSLSATVVEVF